MVLDEAVQVRSACKHYGASDGPKRKDVLINLDMTVSRGTIYGLLGASGCGKTTLLSCIVGRRHLDSGEIWVLGGKPSTPGSGVPGPRIGYMPQDTALIAEFTVKEAVYYFGQIFGMSEVRLSERFKFLSNLLDLPPDNRYVKNCSGGQQRRVSFAAALVHEPELLILDEPTVGLDPVLRDRIWNHMVEISTKDKVAIIITTHYIEETRQAQTIGLMRSGTLLAEENPDYLLTLFRTETLEEVFLYLSEKQSKNQPVLEFQSDEYLAHKQLRNNLYESMTNVNTSNLTIANGSTMELTSTVSNLPSAKRVGSGFHLSRLKSLVHKNWIQLIRHPGGLFFSLLFPIIDLLAFYVAVGGDLHDIKVAVVNNESNWTECQNYLAHYPTASYDPANDTCQMNLLSCRFLNSFNDSFLTKEFYPDLESAVGAVRQGNVVGAMYFNHNYTEAISSRTNDGRYVSDINIDDSAINMWMDMSNRQIGWVIQYDLIDRYIDFAKGVIKDCNQNLKQAELPVHIYEPVYGTKNEKYSVFMTPGMMLTINFFLATLLTSTVLVSDRLEGIWDRTVVAGCTTLEILLSHSITQLTISTMQSIEIVIIVFIVVGVNCIGNYFTVILLLILQGVAGIAYGFLISVYSDTSTTSLYLSTGSFYPMLFLSGIMWPIEGMPYALGQFAKILPFTIPITSVRNVMTRGWAITNIDVFNGFLITIAWVILFCIVSFFKLSKNT